MKKRNVRNTQVRTVVKTNSRKIKMNSIKRGGSRIQ